MCAVPRLLRALPLVGLCVGVLVGLVVLGIRNTGVLVPLELAVYDRLIRSQPEPIEPDPRIVLIAVTEQDIRTEGQYPITDATVAKVLDRLVGYGARAIGLDIYRDIAVPPGREGLNTFLTTHPHIIAVRKVGSEYGLGTPPPPALSGTDQVGFTDIVVDPDGTVRRGLLYLEEREEIAEALGLRLALLYLHSEGVQPQPDPLEPHYLRLGNTTLKRFEGSDGAYVAANAGGYQILLDHKGGGVAPLTYSLTALLSGQVDPQTIQDKIVLVGITAESLHDIFHSPFGEAVAGVAMHAQLVSQLVRAGLEGHQPIATITDKQEGGWMFLWAGFGVLLGLWGRSGWRFSLGVVAGLFLLAAAVFLAFSKGWWIPAIPPALAWLFSASIVPAIVLNRERKERAVLKQLFGKYVSPEVAEVIWEQRDQFLDGGRPRPQRMTVTVLFADLQGYTAAVESSEPGELMDWVNAYLESMAQVIIQHGGVIDDYAGDGIKANFGVPIPRRLVEETRQDAVNAVTCALVMGRELVKLNQNWEAQGRPTVGMRIGIGTGSVVVGSLGSPQRLKYTTVGDTVNIASRLESYEKDLHAPTVGTSPYRILIDGATLECVDERVETEPVGEVRVKGKEQPVTAYRVITGHACASRGRPGC